MSLAASRAVLRQSTFAVRRAGIRNASTTAEATGVVKEKAAQVSSKASEGLSKVESSASSAASKVSDAAGATKAQAGGLIGTVQGE
jgi:F-type H+-transporting ATPase subunit g